MTAWAVLAALVVLIVGALWASGRLGGVGAGICDVVAFTGVLAAIAMVVQVGAPT